MTVIARPWMFCRLPLLPTLTVSLPPPALMLTAVAAGVPSTLMVLPPAAAVEGHGAHRCKADGDSRTVEGRGGQAVRLVGSVELIVHDQRIAAAVPVDGDGPLNGV